MVDIIINSLRKKQINKQTEETFQATPTLGLNLNSEKKAKKKRSQSSDLLSLIATDDDDDDEA